jgi:hypothetical protein
MSSFHRRADCAHRLVIDTDAPFIDRAATKAAAQERKPDDLHRQARPPVGDAHPENQVRAAAFDSLSSREERDDSPIDIRQGRSAVDLPEVLLVAPQGEYTLLLNYPDAEAPQYEIAQVRDTVITVPAGEVRKDALLSNPEFSQRARLAGGAALRRCRVLLWAALLVASPCSVSSPRASCARASGCGWGGAVDGEW